LLVSPPNDCSVTTTSQPSFPYGCKISLVISGPRLISPSNQLTASSPARLFQNTLYSNFSIKCSKQSKFPIESRCNINLPHENEAGRTSPSSPGMKTLLQYSFVINGVDEMILPSLSTDMK